MKNLITCLVVFVLSGAVAAEINHAPRGFTITKTLVTPPEVAAFNGVSVEINRDELEVLPFGSSITIHDFPLGNDYAVNLTLERFDVFTDDAVVVVASMNQNGRVDEQHKPKPDVILLRGSVEGDNNSRCFLALGKQTTNGIIEIDGMTYVLAKDKSRGWTAVYNLNDVEPEDMNWADFQCSVQETVESIENKREHQQSNFGGDCQELQMAIETDWEFNDSLFGGDEVASSEYAATLMGAVSSIYETDVNIAIKVVYLRIWENSSDPWTAGGTGSQLEQFRDYWNANMSGVSRHLAHFLSGRPLGGGVAWLNAVCTDYGYAVSANLSGSFPLPVVDHNNNNWDPFVVAHELGHNCGTSHTHNYDPPIDGCGLGDCSDAWGGTIMSYCHTCSGGMSNIVLSLHPIVQVTIENYLANDIACTLDDCSGDPAGACCVDTSCSIGTAANCSAAGGTYLGDGSSCSGDPCSLDCPEDINGDGYVDVSDLLVVIDQWGLSDSPADINGDGIVDVTDLLIVVGSWGPCGGGSNVWTVDDDGGADFYYIQDAIDAAADGDEILVYPGTYTSTGDNVVDMMGKAVWLHSSDGPNTTIIDGEDVRRGIVCVTAETSETMIEGFTITRGYTDGGYPDNCGGGMFCDNSSSPTIENCTFVENWAPYGGGMFNNFEGASPTITNCTFSANTVTSAGGGMYNYEGASPTITNCIFDGNTSNVAAAGGMCNLTTTIPSNPTITNCIFIGNASLKSYGGGMYNRGSNPVITGCTFENNYALVGGGIENDTINSPPAYPAIENSYFCGNQPDHINGDWGDYGGNTFADECSGDPVGACCVGTSCSTGTAADCSAAGGTYLGDGSSCSGDPCSGDPTGACCVGTSCSTGTAADCSASGGTYLGDGSSCSADPCGAPTGACCVDTSCSTGTAANCSAAGGTYLGDGSSCSGDPCGSGSTVWTVDDSGGADFYNIQDAVDAASDGDEILVYPGTYTDSGDNVVDMNGKSVWLHSIDGPETTIIDGEDARRGIIYVNAKSASLGGFTIQNCYAPLIGWDNGDDLRLGGGLYIGDSSLVMTNCTIDSNDASGSIGWGGGVFSKNAINLVFKDCTFSNNFGDRDGGGIFHYYSTFELENCTFESNAASEGGGGLFLQAGSGTIVGCIISNNSALTGIVGSLGGGIHNMGGVLTLTDTTVCGNTPDQIYGAWTDGGGNYVADTCP